MNSNQIAIASFAFIGSDLVEREIEKSKHSTLRGLRLRLISLADSRFGVGEYRTVEDTSLTGFHCTDREGNTLGLSLGSEMGISG